MHATDDVDSRSRHRSRSPMMTICIVLLVLLAISHVAVVETQKNFYELLGVAKDADDRTIRKAFKKLAMTMHPDKNQVRSRWRSNRDLRELDITRRLHYVRHDCRTTRRHTQNL